jgi:hypothetical protein
VPVDPLSSRAEEAGGLIDTDLYNVWTLPLVRRYGGQTVWYVALDVLGYPPTWSLSLKEADVLRKALIERYGKGL